MFLNLFGDYKSFDVCIIIYESWIHNPIFNKKYGEIRVYSQIFIIIPKDSCSTCNYSSYDV